MTYNDAVDYESDVPSDLSPQLSAKIQALLFVTSLLWEAWVNAGREAQAERQTNAYTM